MSALTYGFFGCGAVLLLLLIRVPIGFALLAVSVIGIWLVRGTRATFGMLQSMPYDFAAHWSLSAVPMFLLMGALASHSGLTSQLYATMRLWLGRLPGGLAVATSFAGAGFAAACGSSLATTAAMGRIAVPEMLRMGYHPGLATGVTTAVGTLGALIPPSIMMVLYAVFAEVSPGKMLIAGILPGLLTAIAYAGLIIVRCKLRPDLAPPVPLDEATWPARFASLKPVWPIFALVFGVIGGIYSGLATATEAGALGVVLAALIGLAQRSLSRKGLAEAIIEAVKGTATIFFIAIGAILFTRFLALTGLPPFLASVAADWSQSPITIIILVSIIYLILGCFLDPLGLLLITLPVFLPIFDALDMNLIWVGVILVKYIEIGLLTPPVGLNLFVMKNTVGETVPLMVIVRGTSWFLLAETIVMILIITFPQISLLLPALME